LGLAGGVGAERRAWLMLDIPVVRPDRDRYHEQVFGVGEALKPGDEIVGMDVSATADADPCEAAVASAPGRSPPCPPPERRSRADLAAASGAAGWQDRAVMWEQARSTYDQVAGRYEARFTDELNGKPRDRQLLDAFAASMGDPVVDIGCGPGQVGAFVRERGRRVVGADLSPAMARRAGRRLDTALAADMRALPLADGAVAGVLAFYSLIHLERPEVEAVLRELVRVLRPGGAVLLAAHEGEGRVVLDEFLGEPVPFVATLFSLDELVAAVRAAGLDVVLAERRAPYPNEGTTARLHLQARRA
jgi:SAM-dependent methyltransferase